MDCIELNKKEIEKVHKNNGQHDTKPVEVQKIKMS